MVVISEEYGLVIKLKLERLEARLRDNPNDIEARDQLQSLIKNPPKVKELKPTEKAGHLLFYDGWLRQDRFKPLVEHIALAAGGSIKERAFGAFLKAYVEDGVIAEPEADLLHDMVYPGRRHDRGAKIEKIPAWIFDFLDRSWLGEMFNAIEDGAYRSQPTAALLACIVSQAALICRKFKLGRGTHPNVMVTVIRPSGAGKENAASFIRKAFAAAGPEASKYLGPEGFTSGAAITSSLREHPTCLAIVDEIGRFFSSLRSRNASTAQSEIETELLRLNGASDYEAWLPKAYANLKDDDNRRVPIVHPSFVLYGTGTPNFFGNDSADLESITGGTIGRLLFSISTNVPSFKATCPGTGIPDSVIEQVRKRAEFKPTEAGNVSEWEAHPAITSIDLTDDAREAFELAQAVWELQARNTAEEDGASIYRRNYEKAAKLALIIASAEAEAGDCEFEVQADHAQWAVCIVNALTRELIGGIKSLVRSNDEVKHIEKLEAHLKSQFDAGEEYVTKREACREARLSSKQRDEAFKELRTSEPMFYETTVDRKAVYRVDREAYEQARKLDRRYGEKL